jgi:hypothetical protein
MGFVSRRWKRGNDVYIELVEMKQSTEPVGESEVFWHLALRTDHLEKSLEAAINAGCEVTVPIRPLDLMNNVTTAPWSVRVAFCFFDRRSLNRFDLLACNQPANIDLGLIRFPVGARDRLRRVTFLTPRRNYEQRTPQQQDQNIPTHQ